MNRRMIPDINVWGMFRNAGETVLLFAHDIYVVAYPPFPVYLGTSGGTRYGLSNVNDVAIQLRSLVELHDLHRQVFP
ncbi:hypothetical protein KQI52_05635 [bacterium]|nr:hypothetical protein [bacterium]